MKKGKIIYLITVILIYMAALPVFAQENAAVAEQMNNTLLKAVDDGHWQVSAEEVSMWLKTGKTDFHIVDVRPSADAYKAGHIPGSVHIPYNEILKSERIAGLPKDKKIILVCATGQLENLPVVPLRFLGYEAYTMAFGYAAWVKDSQGGETMKSIISKAAKKKYPLEKQR